MQLNPTITEELMHTALSIARVAGTCISEIYNDKYSISYKSDKTPVTTADLEAHRIIVEALEALSPDLPVLSEESDSIPYEVRNQWSQYWLVDPLDGTREFIKRNGEFSVNIALIEHGQPVLGVVTAPELEVSYFACRTRGVWKQVGSFHHQLHHRYFECNYGGPEMPWDNWLGSFHDGSPEATNCIPTLASTTKARNNTIINSGRCLGSIRCPHLSGCDCFDLNG